MKKIVTAALLGVVCTLSTILLSVGPRTAKAATPTESEQYKVLVYYPQNRLEGQLNELGSQGWKVRCRGRPDHLGEVVTLA